MLTSELVPHVQLDNLTPTALALSVSNVIYSKFISKFIPIEGGIHHVHEKIMK